MKLTDGERLIVVMLAEVMEEMGLNREIDPALVKRLAINNDDWALKWQYSGIFDGEQPSEDIVKETADILDMWSFIEYSIKELEGDEAEEVANFHHNKFSGFDGNNDRHYGVARTLIKDLGRWTEFKDHPMNSHSRATLARYRAMLPKYEAAMEDRMDGPLSIEALRDLLR